MNSKITLKEGTPKALSKYMQAFLWIISILTGIVAGVNILLILYSVFSGGVLVLGAGSGPTYTAVSFSLYPLRYAVTGFLSFLICIGTTLLRKKKFC